MRLNRTRRLIHSGSDWGFTLLELLVVLVIIAILLAVAIATYVATTSAANAAACRENQTVLNKAADVMRSVEGDDAITSMDDLEPYVKNFARTDVCPADGTPLMYNAATGAVSCPNHP